MEKKLVRQYIEQEQLLQPNSKVLVGLSGGADSVALLRILLDLGYSCEAAHCNFHLRHEESNRDERFVRDLCLQWQVPLCVTHFNTQEEAQKRHISIEMAARDLRYAWFESIRKSHHLHAIAIAHHQDDSVETFLLNLIRGAGLNGLRGIHARNGYVIRPLLALSRKDILQYLEKIGQSYVTDSTNLEDEYLRNKIRLNLLPFLQTLNPSIHNSLIQTTERLEEAYQIYLRGIEEGKKRVWTENGILIEPLLQEPAPGTLLHEILSPLGFNPAQIQDILHALTQQPGKVFQAKDYRIVKDRHLLLIEKIQEILPPRLHYQTLAYTPSFEIPRDKKTACFDADKLSGNLQVRRYQPGDSFIPFGMKGRKKISDYLTDRKFSLFQKEKQWVLCAGEDIIWLIGERTDNRYRIDADTRRVLIIECQE